MTLTSAAVPEVQPRRRRVTPPLVLAGSVLLLSVALHLRDPHEAGSWGFCPWLVTTGTYCPGCGGLRAVNDLTHGDLGAAASSNLLFVASIPAFALMWVRSLQQRWTGVRRAWPARVVAVNAGVALLAVVTFWVGRNLPFASWLAP
jgi:hypothetical protein